MSRAMKTKNKSDTEAIATDNDGNISENQDILSLKWVKWFGGKFERESEAVARRYIGDKPKVEYLSGVEGVAIGSDDSIIIDPGILRSRWGKWLGKKLQKEGDESIRRYLEDRQQRCQAARNVTVERRCGRPKQQQERIPATQTPNRNTSQKRKDSSPLRTNDGGKTSGASQNTVPAANTAEKVDVAADTPTMDAATTAATPPAATTAATPPTATTTTTTTPPDATPTATTPPAATTAAIPPDATTAATPPVATTTAATPPTETTTTTAATPSAATITAATSQVGDSKDGRVAVAVPASSHSSTKPVDDNSTKTDTAANIPAATVDREMRVDPALLRSRWGQWMDQKLKNAGRDDKATRVREGKPKTPRAAEDAAELGTKRRQQAARKEESANGARDEDSRPHKDTNVMEAKTGGVDVQAHHVPSASNDVQPPRTKTPIASKKTTCNNDTTKHTDDHKTSSYDDDEAMDNVLLALCSHFGEDCAMVPKDVNRGDVIDGDLKHGNSADYIGGAYNHAYEWIFGNAMSDAGKTL